MIQRKIWHILFLLCTVYMYANGQEKNAFEYDTIEYIIEYDTIDLPPDTIYIAERKKSLQLKNILINLNYGYGISISEGISIKGNTPIFSDFASQARLLNYNQMTFSLMYSFSKFHLLSGLNFSYLELKIKHLASCNCNNSKYYNKIKSFGLPVGISTKLQRKKSGFEYGLFFNSYFLANGKQNIVLLNNINEISYLDKSLKRNLFLSIQPSINFIYKFSSSLSGYIQSSYEHYLYSIFNQNYNLKVVPRFLMMHAGIRYNIFKKNY